MELNNERLDDSHHESTYNRRPHTQLKFPAVVVNKRIFNLKSDYKAKREADIARTNYKVAI